ncbi:unnamed protein product, partial [marine sediment metagenome]
MPFPHRFIAPSEPFYPYTIPYSCRFNDDDSAYTSITWSDATTDIKKCVVSFWVKRCNLGIDTFLLSGYGNANNNMKINFDSSDQLRTRYEDGGVVDTTTTTMLFRDPTSWYHIFIKFDTADATGVDRYKLWVSGTQITAWSVQQNIPQNSNLNLINNSYETAWGENIELTDKYLDGYLAECYIIDGSVANVVTDFGEFKNNIWIPKSPGTLTYGNHGSYHPFSNASDFGEDFSGNNNDYTDSGLATNDQVLDTPTDNY